MGVVLANQHRGTQECGFSVTVSSGDHLHFYEAGSDWKSVITAQGTAAGLARSVCQQQGVAIIVIKRLNSPAPDDLTGNCLGRGAEY